MRDFNRLKPKNVSSHKVGMKSQLYEKKLKMGKFFEMKTVPKSPYRNLVGLLQKSIC